MKQCRALLSALVVLSCLATAWVTLARPALAGVPAYVHPWVHDRLAEEDTTRVIVSLWDRNLPQARAKDWHDRVPWVQDLSRRAMVAVPSFRVDRQYQIWPFLAGTVDQATLQKLAECPLVEAIYPDLEVHATLSESGPLIGQPEAEAQGYTGAGIGIAIVDTGIDYTHPDLGAPSPYPSGKVRGGYDFANNDTNPWDDEGHGTHVAGIAAGTGQTYRGIAPGAHLLAVKVLDQYGGGTTSDVMAGVEWCITHQAEFNIRAINMSLGVAAEFSDPSECDDWPGAETLRDALAAGIFLAISSGNEGFLHGIGFPACVGAATAVGATYDIPVYGGTADTPTSYSNRGEMVELFAPGSFITSTKKGGGYVTFVGTSMSAPHVAGAAAVLAQQGVTGPVAIEKRLRLTGVPVVDPLTNVQTPRVDLARALAGPATSGPDLVVTAVSSDVSTVSYGDPVTVSISVKNQGNLAAAACTAVVALSGNSLPSPQDYLIATVSVPPLSAGESREFGWVTGSVPEMPTGIYHIIGFVDSSYVVVEKDELNNGLLGSLVRVGFTAMAVNSSIPEFMLKGQTYPVSVTMKNDGDITWTTATGFALGATSPDNTTRWGISRVALPGRGAVLPGESATFSFTVTAPSEPGWYPCHWSMTRGNGFFGEVATGAGTTLVVDDTVHGQNFPAISGERVACEDARGWTGSAISVTNLSTGGSIIIPDDVRVPFEPPWEWFLGSWHWYPDVSGSWVTWMVDDVYEYFPEDDFYFWYFQVVAFNVAFPMDLPRRVTYQTADAFLPAIDGSRIVWEDYTNDPDGIAYSGWDNPDIGIYDLDTSRMYALCTASDWQVSPRISGDLVVWEDWRHGQPDIYLYDLSVDTDGDGVPNWKDSDRPLLDPAEVRLTQTGHWEIFPDISGRTVVWMDLRRDPGSLSVIDIYAMDLDTMVQTPLVTDPSAFRDQPRIDGTHVVWTDYRFGAPDIFWTDLSVGWPQPIAGSAGYEMLPDVSDRNVVYGKYREDYGVWNVVVQHMFTHGSVGVHSFTDVTNDYWAWSYIEAVAANGVAQGFGDGRYGPTFEVSRDQMATYLARAIAGSDSAVPPGPAMPTFSDVPTGHWAYKYIEYCANPSQDVARGYPDGTYQPAALVNRGAMAVFIGRAMAGGDSFFDTYVAPTEPTFPDVTPVPTDPWAWCYKYVEYIKSQGITSGYPDRLYHPADVCTRAQMAVYVSRAFGYLP